MGSRRWLAVWLVVLGCRGGSPPSPPSQSDVTPAAEVKIAARTPVPPSNAAPAPWYRAELSFDKTGTLPFFVQLPTTNGQGILKNGDEAVPVAVEWNGDKVALLGSWNWVDRIDATRGADGRLEGTWTRNTPMWGPVVRAFTAAPIATPDALERFSGSAAPKADLTGVWRFQFKELKLGRGELAMTKDGAVSGYIRPGSLADLRFLSGELQGNKLLLSYFNLNVAFLVTATVSADGKTMSGQMSLMNVWNEGFTAVKTEYTEYANPVRLKKGTSKLTKIPLLQKYGGKPVVLVFGTTWCPACHEMYPFLVKLEAKYRARGLKFVSLFYDLSDDQAVIDAAMEAYKKQYAVTWESAAVATTLDDWARDMPPEIENWDGFPIVAFVRPDGTVANIYGGWFSDATGNENAKLKAQFDRWASELLPR